MIITNKSSIAFGNFKESLENVNAFKGAAKRNGYGLQSVDFKTWGWTAGVCSLSVGFRVTTAAVSTIHSTELLSSSAHWRCDTGLLPKVFSVGMAKTSHPL